MLVAANKADLLAPDSDNLERLRAAAEEAGCDFYVISAATTSGTRELMQAAAAKLAALPPVRVYEADYVEPEVEVVSSDELTIRHEDDLWIIEGEWLQRLLGSINLNDYESLGYMDRRLRECGLFERLEKMGIQDGDTVSIYDMEFDYEK
jgi:GTP-binding protein